MFRYFTCLPKDQSPDGIIGTRWKSAITDIDCINCSPPGSFP
ncbi:Uncharacterized protein dnl_62500 [Desulfonema limicola]|uniref:Uncharacterized protein n=1 Tax=Desulfonema limicola TaxID=45656 RepID=A0A975GJT6_9BACT|nr:Uncharacterized protein dnl_62500 [Desulfonema limicola]